LFERDLAAGAPDAVREIHHCIRIGDTRALNRGSFEVEQAQFEQYRAQPWAVCFSCFEITLRISA